MASIGGSGKGVEFVTELSSVLVLQCAGCRTVLGDSRGFICSSSSMDTFTVAAESITPSVRLMPDQVTSTSGPDMGTVYYAMECCECSSSVGRFYATTPKALDIVRDHFTFDIPAITSYDVGGSRDAAEDEGAAELASVQQAVQDLGSQVAAMQGQAEEDSRKVEMQLLKVENLLLLYNERLEALEGGAHAGGGGEGAPGDDGLRYPWEEDEGGQGAGVGRKRAENEGLGGAGCRGGGTSKRARR